MTYHKRKRIRSMGNNVKAIVSDEQFSERLREANRIRNNPRIVNPESCFYAMFPPLPEDIPEAFMRRA